MKTNKPILFWIALILATFVCTVYGDSLIYLTQTGTVTDPITIDPQVVSTTFYTANLATDSVTTLSSVCSFTLPVAIEFSANGTLWMGGSAENAATVQTRMKYVTGDKWAIVPQNTSYNLGFAADPAATCSLSIAVHTLR